MNFEPRLDKPETASIAKKFWAQEAPNRCAIQKVPAPIRAEIGIVRTHAQTMRPATPQRTAERRRVAPTPTIAPVMVCLVDTGMANELARNSVAAPAVSAADPPAGCSLGVF